LSGFQAHLPALQVLLPLIAAPLCFLLRGDSRSRIFALAVTWSCLAISLALLGEVIDGSVLIYRFGGWATPYGIEYRVDITNAFVLVVVSGVSSVIFLAGAGRDSGRVPPGREHLFYAAILLCLCGLLGVTITGDVFNVFVFLEISSLSSYILIAMGHSRRALTAAFSYLVMGTIGATFLLIGIGLMYQMTGTLNMEDMAERLDAVEGQRTIRVALAFVMVGISTKLAVFPLHQWLPNAYTFAPAVVSAFLASTATKVAYYLMLRFSLGLFGFAYVFETIGIDALLMALSIMAMFAGSTAAIYQNDLKRLLAFSSIAQIGYMTLGLSLASQAGITAGLIHLFNHALMKGALFLVAACVVWKTGSTRIEDMRGLGRRMPLSMAALVLAGLALVGVPGTAGFVSKWALVRAALEQDSLLIVFAIMLSSLLAMVYVWRLVEVVFLSPPPEGGGPTANGGTKTLLEVPLQLLVPTWILAAGCLWFGLFSSFATDVAGLAAAQLLGGTQ